MWRAAMILCLGLCGPGFSEGYQTFQGHGGPVMAVAVSKDGSQLLTASFDYSVGLWTIAEPTQPIWLEGHRAAVSSVVFLPNGDAASGGDDYAVILWDLSNHSAIRRLLGHQGKIAAVQPSPDGTLLASASWDGTVRLWSIETGQAVAVLRGHDGGVNDVAWAANGQQLFSASYDGTIVEWDARTFQPARSLVRHGFGINRIVIDEAGDWLAYGAVDGGTRVIDLHSGNELADMTLDRRPILALAKSPDGSRVAVGDGEGFVMVVSTEDWTVTRDFHAAVNGPIWSLAFTGDGNGVIAAGIADEVALWPLDGADDLPKMAELKRKFHANPATLSNGERQFLRKCSICHTLGASGDRRAGPALQGLFGRKAGTLAGYNYSQAILQSDIIWSEQTINRLFELGPDHYTPGSKMPMQRITSAQDRADLITFLKRETATGD
ncbi:MAG: c-type cytochrome [Paracoccaceae bacterium]